MSAGEIIGLLIMAAGGYLWIARNQLLAGVITIIIGVLIFVGALSGTISI